MRIIQAASWSPRVARPTTTHDLFATRPGDPPLLVQVCVDTAADETWEREVRALEAAARAHPDAGAVLVTQDASPPLRGLPAPLQWMSATRWLLG